MAFPSAFVVFSFLSFSLFRLPFLQVNFASVLHSIPSLPFLPSFPPYPHELLLLKTKWKTTYIMMAHHMPMPLPATAAGFTGSETLPAPAPNRSRCWRSLSSISLILPVGVAFTTGAPLSVPAADEPPPPAPLLLLPPSPLLPPLTCRCSCCRCSCCWSCWWWWMKRKRAGWWVQWWRKRKRWRKRG